jgi:probable H4MPT-linked C1 transfer pathway protein
MQKRQLLYTGIERTPVATMLESVQIDDAECPLMKERFADSNDVYLVLGQVPEQADNLDTADGRSRTILDAAARLARMVGEDLETISMATVTSIANQIAARQLRHIIEGVSENLRQLAQSDQHRQSYSLVFSGHGRFLSQAIIEGCPEFPLVPLQLEDLLGKSISRCAPAFAVARLLQVHLGQACYD